MHAKANNDSRNMLTILRIAVVIRITITIIVK